MNYRPTNQKIALATWFPRDPDSPKGGVEAVSVNLAAGLARDHETEVHVVTLDENVISPKVHMWGEVVVHRLPRDSGSLLRFATGQGRRIVQSYLLGLGPAVVHAHDTFGMMTRGLDMPRVFTIHGFIHEDTRYRGGVKAHLRAELWKREELATWAEQPHVVSISPYVRERLRGIATGVIHDIENPISLECFDLDRDKAPRNIFTAAVISERKNTMGLVKAFVSIAERHPEARLRLAGPIVEPEYGERLVRFVEKSGFASRIDLLGSIPRPDVLRELAKASVFALVSFEEGAPMGISEAMAAGVPILTSNRCGMPYMIRNNESGLLADPKNQEEIASQLDALLSDSARRRDLGAKARITALDSFHPDRVAARTRLVYKQAMDEFNKRGGELQPVALA